MLTNLHVKNLALIDEVDIDFSEGLNILTGETGAGKSIILGSINIALGGKCNADIIRKGAEYALTELVFHTSDEDTIEALKLMDIEDVESGEIIISRKVMPSRSQIKVNGMTCTAAQVKQIAGLLIDIHGQHDNQLLLMENKHLEMVDSFGGKKLSAVKEEYKNAYKAYKEIEDKLQKLQVDEEQRARELAFVEFEINEITEAKLVVGEDEELEARFKKMSNAQKIISELNQATQVLRGQDDNVCDMLSMALKACINASAYDESLLDLVNELQISQDTITNISRAIVDYADDCEYDSSDYELVKNRLDMINSFKMKYGKTIEDILEYCDSRQLRFNELNDYDNIVNGLKAELGKLSLELAKTAEKLTQIRKESAKSLCEQVSEGLKNLNFMNNEFSAEFTLLKEFGHNGMDNMRFIISTNIGQDMMPLSKIASGGELSRIMLAVKCCMAGLENRQTLIFDEIDAGISGKTAQMVANNLHKLSDNHQIICITHLPQIAAMSDRHFVIDKYVKDSKTYTSINMLSEEESVNELARLLGGAALTDAVISNAREMKALAKKDK